MPLLAAGCGPTEILQTEGGPHPVEFLSGDLKCPTFVEELGVFCPVDARCRRLYTCFRVHRQGCRWVRKEGRVAVEHEGVNYSPSRFASLRGIVESRRRGSSNPPTRPSWHAPCDTPSATVRPSQRCLLNRALP